MLKAAMGYALGIFLASTFYWRNPIAIAAISNLCAGDGMADIIGRRYGSWKFPYNKNKSYVGSIGMTIAGFSASTCSQSVRPREHQPWRSTTQNTPKPMALTITFFSIPVNTTSSFYSSLNTHRAEFLQLLKVKPNRRIRRKLTSSAAMFSDNIVVSDIIATGVSGGIALSLLKFWEQTSKRGIFDQKLNRKLVHVTLGLAFMLCWPMFSSGRQGAILAGLIPGINVIKMLLLGLGIWKDDATVKSMSRFGDHRELLKGPLYYALTISLASAIYWRTSPIAIAAVCNLCAGDGMADIVGRRFGSTKLPYNQNKSIIGSITMASAGFLASIGYMLYFSSFGYIEESTKMVFGFLLASIVAALVESHPFSTELDDNLTVPLVSVLVGGLVF
ncbi:hypothetical protein RD792_010410 [Penstemon davidsonii]|uniref:Phytol kinase 3, chloroplastic n=1 Tax=Penstemon davidsonii TaxID=160366 RepID=A0ABR0D1W2_9LAMI|nr:hypothetical protein RD792_010410 [Penstemon davidsonii]